MNVEEAVRYIDGRLSNELMSDNDREVLKFCRDVLSGRIHPRVGHWVKFKDEADYLFYRCDLCGKKEQYTSPFCPNCSAYMENYEDFLT